MSKEIKVKLVAQTDDAVKDIEKVGDATERVTNEAERADEAFQDMGKTVKTQTKAAKGLGSSFKAAGAALKAIGIGIIIALVAKLTQVFTSNQKVVDFFSNSMNFLTIAFNDLFNFLDENIGTVVDYFKQIFDDPVQSLKDLGTAIKENIIERFESALEVLGFLGDAAKKFFEGDFAGALESAKQAGAEWVDVMTGVDDSVNKIAAGVVSVTDAIVDYTSETYKAAEALTQMENNSLLAAAQQARLVEQFDRQAESQRQIRDNIALTVEDRIAANAKLKTILEDQEKAMLAQASAQVAAAQAQVNLNNSIENQVALTEALTNKEGVLAQVNGFKSEQIVNEIALKQELNDLNQTGADAETERRLAQLAFEESQELTAAGKLEKQRERLELENQLIAEDIAKKRELYLVGTQQRADAEAEYLAKKQNVDNQIAANEKAANEEKEADEDRLKNAKIAIASQGLNALAGLAKEGSALAKGIAASQATINTFQGVTAALSATSVIPEPFGTILKFANAAAIGISGISNVKKILATQPVSSSAPAGGESAPPPPPSFNLVEGTESNQIATGLANNNAKPINAFVTSTSMTSQQELDRNTERNSAL
jgi:hypothetical protein